MNSCQFCKPKVEDSSISLATSPFFESSHSVDQFRQMVVVSPLYVDVSEHGLLVSFEGQINLQHVFTQSNYFTPVSETSVAQARANVNMIVERTETIGPMVSILNTDPIVPAGALSETSQKARLVELVELLSQKILDEQLRARFLQRMAEEIGNLSERQKQFKGIEELSKNIEHVHHEISAEIDSLKALIEKKHLFLPTKETEIERLEQSIGKMFRQMHQLALESLDESFVKQDYGAVIEQIAIHGSSGNGQITALEEDKRQEVRMKLGKGEVPQEINADVQTDLSVEIESLRNEIERKENLLAAKEAEIESLKEMELLLAAKEEEIERLKEKEVFLPATAADIEKLKHTETLIKHMENLLAAKEEEIRSLKEKEAQLAVKEEEIENLKKEVHLAATAADVENFKYMEALLAAKETEIDKLKQTTGVKIRELQEMALENLGKTQAQQEIKKKGNGLLSYIGKRS